MNILNSLYNSEYHPAFKKTTRHNHQNFRLTFEHYAIKNPFLFKIKWASPLQLPLPLNLCGAIPLCAPLQHHFAVNCLIATCVSLAEHLCNRKKLLHISVTRSLLLQKRAVCFLTALFHIPAFYTLTNLCSCRHLFLRSN